METKKRFKVISMHYTTECNLNCPFCYKKRTDKSEEKPLEFWYKLIPYASELTNQIALGGGEPFTNISFIKKFGKLCKKNKILLNVTSNGKLLIPLKDIEIKEIFKNITMISFSFDRYKISSKQDLIDYVNLVKRIKSLTKTQVGSNLLVQDFSSLEFIKIVNMLFKIGTDRVFALCPKNIPSNILKLKDAYTYLTLKYPNFYVDDLTQQILSENKYKDWCKECHYFKDIISINEKGFVTGCSFDDENKALLKLGEPKDILKIKRIEGEKRFSCPYLILKDILLKGGEQKDGNIKSKL